jgi:hypothetical protein
VHAFEAGGRPGLGATAHGLSFTLQSIFLYWPASAPHSRADAGHAHGRMDALLEYLESRMNGKAVDFPMVQSTGDRRALAAVASTTDVTPPSLRVH